ncbi:hypothetical protein BJ742DRAFT_798935 [Cladochytrium replicatum]|nr:hypothetical protein BJ742DRAFT_798935 [Cladochytrium replicatum]
MYRLLALLAASSVVSAVSWTGAVTDQSFTVCFEAQNGTRLWAEKTGSSTSSAQLVDLPSSFNTQLGFGCANVTGLAPATSYSYGTEKSGTRSTLGSVTTFPTLGTATNFKFTFGNAARWSDSQSNPAWNAMALKKPDFMVILGDLFYGDLSTTDLSQWKTQLTTVLSNQQSFFKAFPVAYMLNDRDYADAGDKAAAGRSGAIEYYKTLTPHYSIGADQAGLYHAFTYGKVRFILTDLHSESDFSSRTTTLGSAQKQWLFQELSQWKNYSMVVWGSTKAWIGRPDYSTDDWFAYESERTEISNYISSLGITNLVMIAGSARFLAADDGSNSDYTSLAALPENRKAGFPVMHGAPLSDYGLNRGGPFSEGCFGYSLWVNFQYSMMEVTDNATHTCFAYSGYNAQDSADYKTLSLSRCINHNVADSSWVRRGTTGGTGTCLIPVWPNWLSAVVGIMTVVAVFALSVGFFFLGIRLGWWTRSNFLEFFQRRRTRLHTRRSRSTELSAIALKEADAAAAVSAGADSASGSASPRESSAGQPGVGEGWWMMAGTRGAAESAMEVTLAFTTGSRRKSATPDTGNYQAVDLESVSADTVSRRLSAVGRDSIGATPSGVITLPVVEDLQAGERRRTTSRNTVATTRSWDRGIDSGVVEVAAVPGERRRTSSRGSMVSRRSG